LAEISNSSQCLSRRPAERAPSHQVDVQVIDRLPAVFAMIDDDAIALVQAASAGDLRRDSQEVPQ